MEAKIRELINYLNKRTEEYDNGNPTISDAEWDAKYFELVALEEEYNIRFNDSPTQKVVYNVVNQLNKKEHNHAMLSLEKTKDTKAVVSFLSNKLALCMCKMDGLTCSLKYAGGRLVSAETRGNGLVGEDILHNALVIPSIPKVISYKEDLIVDGEIICTYEDFEQFKNDYKNPRNFAAGSIRLLNANECGRRNLTFVAWDVIEGFNDTELLSDKLNLLEGKYNFTVVPFIQINNLENIDSIIEGCKQSAITFSYPIDGCVFKFDNIAYGKTLGKTDHHFKNAIAFKFYDETYPSKMLDIEWGMGRTGVLTPVAVFEPIEIDGSIVERASLHNISVMMKTMNGGSYVGQPIEVFKANMIIPQIAWADGRCPNPQKQKMIPIPEVCPICGAPTEKRTNDDVITLWCTNDNCEGKLVNKIDHYCGKKGLDIKGLAKTTIEKLIDWGWLYSIRDIYALHLHRNDWIKQPGFGVASVDKILAAIEQSKTCQLDAFISALGIPLVGRTIAKEITKYYSTWQEFRDAVGGDWTVFDGFGDEISKAINTFDYIYVDQLGKLLTFEEPQKKESNTSMDGITFCVTGKLKVWKNRDELKAYIENAGGKVVGSMSSHVQYLINNDVTSTSAKNKAAQSAGIPIIDEAKFIELFGQN